MQHYDVVVAGCGPVGALLSLLLASSGVRVLNVDRDTAPYSAPRAVAADDATLRQIGAQCTGLARWLHESSLHCPIDLRTGPPTDPRSWSVIGPEPPRLVPETGFMDTLFLHQPDFEAQLRGRLVRNPNATLQLGKAMTGFRLLAADSGASKAARVAVTLEDISSASSTAVTARFLVGADGGASTVRRLMGAGFEGSSFPDEPWVVVDVETEDADVLATWTCFNFICDTGRPFVHVPLPGNSCGRRFEFMLLAGEKPDDMSTREAAAALLRKHARVDPAALRLRRIAVYTFHARMATTWRVGPVLLAGDAAHCMPPFRGQGMCAGLRDAAALSWRLAHIIGGHADEEALLPSYETERRAHVASIVRVAALMGRLITIRNKPIALLRNLAFGFAYRCPLTHAHIKTPFTPSSAVRDGLIHGAAVGAVPTALRKPEPDSVGGVSGAGAAAGGGSTTAKPSAANDGTASGSERSAGDRSAGVAGYCECGAVGQPLPNFPVVYVTAGGRHIRGRFDEFLTHDGPQLLAAVAAAATAATSAGTPATARSAAEATGGAGALPAASGLSPRDPVRGVDLRASAVASEQCAQALPAAYAPPWIVLLGPHTIRRLETGGRGAKQLRAAARAAFGDAVVIVQMLPGSGGASRAKLHSTGIPASSLHPQGRCVRAQLSEPMEISAPQVMDKSVRVERQELRAATDRSEIDPTQEAAWCDAADVAFVDIDGAVSHWLRGQASNADVAIVRPDRVVYGAYLTATAAASALSEPTGRGFRRRSDMTWVHVCLIFACLGAVCAVVANLCARTVTQSS